VFGPLVAEAGIDHLGEHHPWFGQAIRRGRVECIAVHEDDVAGFAGESGDMQWYTVDDGLVVQVALETVAAIEVEDAFRARLPTG